MSVLESPTITLRDTAPPLAIGCAIAGGVCGVTPTFVNEIGPWLLPVGGIALLVGLTWFIVQRRASIRASQVGGEKLAAAQAAAEVNDFNKLRDELTSAITALSLNKPELAKAVKKRSG